MSKEELYITILKLASLGECGDFKVISLPNDRKALFYDNGKRAWVHVLFAYGTKKAKMELEIIISNYMKIKC